VVAHATCDNLPQGAACDNLPQATSSGDVVPGKTPGFSMAVDERLSCR